MEENNQPVYEFKYIEKLWPLYTMFGMSEVDETDGYDFIIIEGGRGGGKTETIAQVGILVSRLVKIKLLCTREVQNTMKDSVKAVLEEWIEKMNLSSEFYITKDSIRNKFTGSEFIFKGMKASNQSDSVKSLKGVAWCWYEEAQTATIESLEKLTPTIREPYRKLIFSLNRKTNHDAVIKHFENKGKVLRIRINYDENPFCPDNLIEEAEELKQLDYDRYLHVWKGQPLPDDASLVVLPYSWLTQCVDLHKKVGHIKEEFLTLGGFDIADGMTTKHDKNSFSLRNGPIVHFLKEWQIDEVYKSVDKIDKWHSIFKFDQLFYDATGVGTAAKSKFAEKDQKKTLRYKVSAFKGAMSPYGKDKLFTGSRKERITNGAMFKNAKAQSWWNLRLRLENSMRLINGEKLDKDDYYISFSSKIPDLDSIFIELAQATYDYDNSGKIIIDKAPGQVEVEIDGKKRTRKSPNKADSIIYAFTGDLIGGLKAHKPKPKKAKVIG